VSSRRELLLVLGLDVLPGHVLALAAPLAQPGDDPLAAFHVELPGDDAVDDVVLGHVFDQGAGQCVVEVLVHEHVVHEQPVEAAQLADDLTGHLLAVLVDDAHRLHVGGDLREPLLRLAPLALPRRRWPITVTMLRFRAAGSPASDSAAAASAPRGVFRQPGRQTDGEDLLGGDLGLAAQRRGLASTSAWCAAASQVTSWFFAASARARAYTVFLTWPRSTL